MKLDRFCKVLLTIIALLLGTIAFTSSLRPEVVRAESRLSEIQFVSVAQTMMGSAFFVFDAKTGDIWIYALNDGSVNRVGKLTALGKPLAK